MPSLTNSRATTVASEQDQQKVATINAALQVLDSLEAGKLDVTITTANVTLTGTPAAPQAQNKYFNLSGTLTGNRDLIFPVNDDDPAVGNPRVIVVKNGTSGAFTVTVKVSGQTGVTVTQGSTAILLHNGTDFVKGPEWLTSTGTPSSYATDMISGLKLIWNSATSISVDKGSAYIPGSSSLVQVAATITKSSLSLSNNTWYHAYLYLNSGTADVEIVTTAPASYFGTAYQKTGDSTRRYVGSLRTDGSGNVRRFLHDGTSIFYLVDVTVSPFAVLSNGSATSETNVDCSALIPVTSRVGLFQLVNDGSVVLWFGNSADGVTQPGAGFIALGTTKIATPDLPLDSSQQISYAFTSATSGAYAYVRGYRFER